MAFRWNIKSDSKRRISSFIWVLAVKREYMLPVVAYCSFSTYVSSMPAYLVPSLPSMSSALYPTTMIPFLIPLCESASNEYSNRVFFPNGIRPLGSLAVLGQSLSPSPAAKITKIVRRFPHRVRRYGCLVCALMSDE